MKRLAVLIVAVAALLCRAEAGAAPALAPSTGPLLTIARDAPERVIFNWDTDRCAKTDIPDAPPRAFRDFAGRVHLLATHQDNRAFIGPDFDHLSHSCDVIYQGDHLDDPGKFDDRQWLTAFVTDDGRNIFALVHDEFQGNLRPALCPSRKYLSCWYNAITAATSTDGGKSFHQLPAPDNVVAAPSVAYAADAGRPIGYFQPTNIVRKDGFYYFMFLATKAGDQTEGICVARTDRPADAGSWRAWDGSGYNARLAGPYLDPTAKSPHVCLPVGRGQLFELGSLAYDRVSRLFIYLGGVSGGAGDALHPRGAYYSTSADLITWSPAIQLLRSPSEADATGRRWRYGLFSIIDEASPSMDYSDIGSYGSLYLYYVKFDLSRQPYARILAKQRITAKGPS